MLDNEYRAMFELEDRLWWYEGMRAITWAILNRYITAGCLVLDVGCGTGYSMIWMRERFQPQAVFGIDVAPSAREFWRERGIVSAALASVDRLPFEDEKFDLVTCFDVIYELDRETSSAALAEICRVLKPGGLLFIREPAYDWLRGTHDVAVGTRQRFTLSELRQKLVAQGLAPKRMTYANTFLFTAAVPYRIVSGWRNQGQSDVRPVPPAANRLLALVLRLEAKLVRLFGFPFGLSVIGVAEKR